MRWKRLNRRKETSTYETFRRVVHESKLESLLIQKTFGESTAQRVRRQRALLRKLQLGEKVLQQTRWRTNYLNGKWKIKGGLLERAAFVGGNTLEELFKAFGWLMAYLKRPFVRRDIMRRGLNESLLLLLHLKRIVLRSIVHFTVLASKWLKVNLFCFEEFLSHVVLLRLMHLLLMENSNSIVFFFCWMGMQLRTNFLSLQIR